MALPYSLFGQPEPRFWHYTGWGVSKAMIIDELADYDQLCHPRCLPSI